tara:strand:+ start:526 stop:654 length:129 start_codon:yes stop_codon:yes gene_type:complete
VSYSPEGKNKFYDVLGRFATAAYARGDAQVSAMATQMRDHLA